MEKWNFSLTKNVAGMEGVVGSPGSVSYSATWRDVPAQAITNFISGRGHRANYQSCHYSCENRRVQVPCHCFVFFLVFRWPLLFCFCFLPLLLNGVGRVWLGLSLSFCLAIYRERLLQRPHLLVVLNRWMDARCMGGVVYRRFTFDDGLIGPSLP